MRYIMRPTDAEQLWNRNSASQRTVANRLIGTGAVRWAAAAENFRRKVHCALEAHVAGKNYARHVGQHRCRKADRTERDAGKHRNAGQLRRIMDEQRLATADAKRLKG